MISRKNETSEKQKQHLLLIAPLGGLLIILLAVFFANLARTGGLDALMLSGRSAARDIPQPLQTFLKEQAGLMSIPLQEGSQAYWYLARAGGIVSYLLFWLATCWGIMMSSKIFKGFMDFAKAFALHEYLPILGMVFAALHALILLGDSYIDFDLGELLIPFTSSYKPFWTGLGSLAFYLSLALIISFYIRQKIGQKTWRALHYTSFLAFLLILLHGFMAGSDSGTTVMRVLYLSTGGIVLFLIYFRLLAFVPKPNRQGRRSSS